MCTCFHTIIVYCFMVNAYILFLLMVRKTISNISISFSLHTFTHHQINIIGIKKKLFFFFWLLFVDMITAAINNVLRFSQNYSFVNKFCSSVTGTLLLTLNSEGLKRNLMQFIMFIASAFGIMFTLKSILITDETFIDLFKL